MKTVANIAVTMLDTRRVPGYVLNPFDPNHSLKKAAITKLPPDLYFLGTQSLTHCPLSSLTFPFLVRTVQLLKGIAFAFDLDYSLSEVWAPLARKTILQLDPDRATDRDHGSHRVGLGLG